MSIVTYKEVRAWGVDNGYKCRTGKLGAGIVAAFAAAHPDDVIVDLPQLAVAEEPEPSSVEAPTFTVNVEIDGHHDAAASIAEHLVEAVWAAFQAGRSAERQAMLAQLSGTA